MPTGPSPMLLTVLTTCPVKADRMLTESASRLTTNTWLPSGLCAIPVGAAPTGVVSGTLCEAML